MERPVYARLVLEVGQEIRWRFQLFPDLRQEQAASGAVFDQEPVRSGAEFPKQIFLAIERKRGKGRKE